MFLQKKLRYTKVLENNLVLQTSQNKSEQFCEQICQSIEYIQNSEEKLPPFEDFPDISGYVLQPKHYLVIADTWLSSQKFYTSTLQNLLDFKAKNHLEGIILIGKKWLGFDQSPFAISQDGVHFIFYKEQKFAVLLDKKDILKLLNTKQIRPQAWIWLMNIDAKFLV